MNALTTLGEAIDRHGIDVDAHLDRAVTIPVLTGLQAQGDVMVVPRPAAPPATTPVPPDGAEVVKGEFGGHTHTLLAEGEVRFDRVPADADPGLDLGTLTVPTGALAYLAHPEHAYSGIGPGTYVLRRQRELDTGRPAPAAQAARTAQEAARAARAARPTPVRYVAD